MFFVVFINRTTLKMIELILASESSRCCMDLCCENKISILKDIDNLVA